MTVKIQTSQVITLPDVTSTQKTRSWLRYEHPYYSANKAKWEYVRDHYTGDLVDPKRIARYLERRFQGEPDKAYDERSKLSDYTPHFAQGVESMAGMLFAVEGDANRRFVDDNGKGLGDPANPATPIGRLWQRANPDGDGYLTVLKQLAIELTHSHFAWVFCDPAAGESQVLVLPALMVPNWTPDFSEVLVIESSDNRTSLQDQPADGFVFLHLTAFGWQRYTEDKNGNPVRLTRPGDSGTWHFETQSGKPRAPVYGVRIPMKRPIGYQMARKANVIFNQESVRDHLLRIAGFPKLVLAADDTLYEKLGDGIDQGANLLQESPTEGGNGHRYIAADTTHAERMTATIDKKIDHFHKTFHQAYDDSAAQRTATEVRQEVGSGTGAFLQLLKAALDDAENNLLPLLEQAEFPNDRARWFIARVERTDDFMPADPDAVQEKSAKAAFGDGKPVPMGVTAKIALAKEIAAQRGAAVNEDELSAHVRVQTLIEILESAPTTGLKLPAEVRAELVMLAIAASGLIPKEATELMEDGQLKSRLELMRAKLVKLMEAEDVVALRDAELLASARNDTGGNLQGSNLGGA